MLALEKAVSVYMEAGALMAVPVSHIDISVGGEVTKGYLHLPAGEGPFPFVINSFGSDVTKEDSFDLFHRELEPRGIAMLAVDMPGIGEARQFSMQDGSDAVMEGALNYLRQSEFADQNNIFIVAGSFGGNAAARAFYRLDVAGVVSMCAPLHSPFLAPLKCWMVCLNSPLTESRLDLVFWISLLKYFANSRLKHLSWFRVTWLVATV